MRKELLLFSACIVCLALMGCAAGPKLGAGPHPEPLYQPAPVYPEKAYKANVAGDVRLSILVGEIGQTEKVKVLSEEPAGQGLSEAARTAVKKWIWQPARKGGEAVPEWVRVDVRFVPGKGNRAPVRPLLIQRTPARYPMGYTGPRNAAVLLHVKVDMSGYAVRTVVIRQQPSDPALAKAARHGVEKWRWKPGHPGWTYVIVKFSTGGEAQENLNRGGSKERR